jgi:hypothetical protein
MAHRTQFLALISSLATVIVTYKITMSVLKQQTAQKLVQPQFNDKGLTEVGTGAFQMFRLLQVMCNHSIGVDAPITLFGVLTIMDTKTSLSP